MRLVIDTDTAGDDVVSLMVALLTEGVSIEGITINVGNVAFDHQVENALKTLEITGYAQKVPVYPGMRQPLMREWVSADYVHGKDGMGDAGFAPVVQRAESTHAVAFLIEASHRWKDELVIVAQAPLTNLAMAVRQDPTFSSRIRQLWIMGGANNTTGNVEPLSEYNFYVDPEAAAIVFGAGFNLFMVGWEIALRDSILTLSDLDRIR
ncbi:MAG: nucleoside hydrolase, partial [Bacilli bacterium]